MKPKFTIHDILNSPVGKLNQHLTEKTPKTARKLPNKRSKEKEWLNTQLWAWGQEKGLKCEKELKGWHPGRKYRFDFAFPEINTAIEYEGLASDKSRHTTITGYTEDTNKYRDAAMLGWTVLRYTVLNYKQVIKDLDKIFSEKSCK